MGNHLEVQLVNPDIISIPSLGNRRENPPPPNKKKSKIWGGAPTQVPKP